MPLTTILDRGLPGAPAPLEGADESSATGALFSSSFYGGLGGTGIAKGLEATDNSAPISHDDAVKALKDQNYDTAGVPAKSWTTGALQVEMNRQSIQAQDRSVISRAPAPGVGGFVAGLAGSLADPLNLALTAFGGGAVATVRAGLVKRMAIGAATGATIVGGSDAAIAHMTGHDEDILSMQTLRDTMFGATAGGLMHGALGPRPLAVPGGGPVTLSTIDALERSEAAAKARGVPVDQVVSKAGAIGRYQIMPETGEAHGISRWDLFDPEKNAQAAQAELDKLNKMFPKDPEAVAIGYNAGPGTARKFIGSGRDYSILPKETQDYVARLRGMSVNTRMAAGQTAVIQSMNDSPVNVKPVVEQATNEEFHPTERDGWGQYSHLQEPLDAAFPERDSVFTKDPESVAALRQMEQFQTTEAPKPVASDQVNAIDPELQKHVTDDVQEAKQMGSSLGNDKTEFNEPEPLLIDGMKPDEHQKAVEAAVRCGIANGSFE